MGRTEEGKYSWLSLKRCVWGKSAIKALITTKNIHTYLTVTIIIHEHNGREKVFKNYFPLSMSYISTFYIKKWYTAAI